MKRLIPVFTLLLAALALGFSASSDTAFAQDAPLDACPAFVEQALAQLDTNCDDLPRNTACYGYTEVDTTFNQPMPADFFTQPADQAELLTISTLRTLPYDQDGAIWGIAVMNVQANVPNTTPGQGVTFLVMGDAEVNNQVSPEQAFLPGDPQALQLATTAAAYVTPSEAAQIVAQLPAGATVEADARSVDGAWLRVAVNNRVAWLPRAAVDAAAPLDALPVYSASARTPMQSFYFSTGLGPSRCTSAPNLVTIQGREDVKIDLTVNGVDVRIGSTIHFRSIGEDQVAFTVQEGTLELVDGTVVNAGESLDAVTDDSGNIVAFGPVRPATQAELDLGRTPQDALSRISGDRGSAPLMTTDDGEIIHIVQTGETLYSIARLYTASMPAIVARNGLANPRNIVVGQRLVIPNPGSGFVALGDMGAVAAGQADAPSPALDCAFQALTPNEGLAFGINTFSWEPVSGAARYRVSVVNIETGQIGSFATSGSETSLTASIDQSSVGWGFDFRWWVQALDANGTPLCQTDDLVMQRGDYSGVVVPPAPAGFNATWACAGPGQLQVSWSGAGANDVITINYNAAGVPNIRTEIGANGTKVYPVAGAASLGSISTASGLFIALPGSLSC